MSMDQLNQNSDDDNIRTNETIIPETNCYSEDTVKNLTGGLKEIYQPHLKKLQVQLSELTMKQNVLVEQLHNENLKLAWSQNSTDYQDMFKQIHLYRDKLINIKREMRSLHEKSSKLKKRAVRLQQLKEKEEAFKMQQQQKELDLIAK